MIRLDGTISEPEEVDEVDEVDEIEVANEESQEAAGAAGPTIEPAARIINDVLTKIAEAEADCEDAEEQVNLRKTELKEAKAAYDSCVQRLRSLARQLRHEEAMPLMPAFVAAEVAGSKPDNDATSDAWRTAAIGDLAIPDGVVEKLLEAGIETIGDLENLRADITNGRAKWPKGIGPAKVTMIEDAVIQWLAVHQDYDTDGSMEENGSDAEDLEEDYEEVEGEAAA